MEDTRTVDDKILAIAKARWPEMDTRTLRIVTVTRMSVTIPVVYPDGLGRVTIEIEDVDGLGLGYDPKLNILAVKVESERNRDDTTRESIA